jgi:hypothetical protein
MQLMMMKNNFSKKYQLPSLLILIQLIFILIFNMALIEVTKAKLNTKYQSKCKVSTYKALPSYKKNNRVDDANFFISTIVFDCLKYVNIASRSFSEISSIPLYKYSIWSKATFS